MLPEIQRRTQNRRRILFSASGATIVVSSVTFLAVSQAIFFADSKVFPASPIAFFAPSATSIAEFFSAFEVIFFVDSEFFSASQPILFASSATSVVDSGLFSVSDSLIREKDLRCLSKKR
jgi:hypothetical protein